MVSFSVPILDKKAELIFGVYLEFFRGFFSLSVDFFLSFFSLGSLTFLTLGTFGIF